MARRDDWRTVRLKLDTYKRLHALRMWLIAREQRIVTLTEAIDWLLSHQE